MSDRRSMTLGDGVAVVALLAFILGWLGLVAVFVLWRIDTDSLPSNADDWSVGEGVGITLLAAMPGLWASNLVKRIVIGSWSVR